MKISSTHHVTKTGAVKKKVAVMSKDEMKKILGKSPDLSDAFMMRMYYEIKNLKSTGRYAIAFA